MNEHGSTGGTTDPSAAYGDGADAVDTLPGLARAAADLLDADGAAVALAAGGGHTIASAVGLLDALRGRTCPAAAVTAGRRPGRADVALLLNDAVPSAEDSRAFLDGTGAEHVMAVPLELDERRRGALLAARAAGRAPFTEADARLLRMLARQAATVLETARLREEVAGLERALTDSTARLARAVRVRDEFFSRVNHEVRTPLNAILCYGELLQDSIFGELTEPQRRAVARVQQAGDRLRTLVEEAFDLSELKAGPVPVHSGPIDLVALVEEVVASLRPEAERRGIAIDLDANAAATLETDALKVRRILLIICSRLLNLVECGTVGVRVFPTDEGAGIELGHDGGELAVPALERVARDFAAELPDADGDGLGLVIARRLALRLGGRLTVQWRSRHAVGFRLLLPARVPAIG